jgi:uncharacterized protein (DUF433 family)
MDEQILSHTMTDEALLQRITLNPAVLAGKPVIAGTRLSVEFIVNMLAHGASEQEILAEYPRLTPNDIQASLLFAARSLQQASFMPLGVGTP